MNKIKLIQRGTEATAKQGGVKRTNSEQGELWLWWKPVNTLHERGEKKKRTGTVVIYGKKGIFLWCYDRVEELTRS